MNIKQLKYVCAIIDLGSFSSAAAHEGVSVQAVSKAMGELEGKLGAPLFDRGSAGVRATSFGRAFASRARRVLDEWNSLERFAFAGSQGELGVAPFAMGFCAPGFKGAARFSTLISVVSERVLGRKVSVEVVDCGEGIRRLNGGELDAVITVGPVEEEGVVCGRLGTMASDVLLSKHHPLADAAEITLEQLGGYPVLRPSNFPHYSESVVDVYCAHGLRSEVYDAAIDEVTQDFFVDKDGFSFIVAGGLTAPSEEYVVRPLAKADAVAIPICLSTLEGAGLDYVAFRRALASMSLFS